MAVDPLMHLAEVRAGKTVVFTNGVFDVLHAGHVRLLQQARALGDILVVGINTDASVRGLGKGVNRPINCLEDRILVLESLRSVDIVLPFAEFTPTSLIESVKPDLHVKGGDYRAEDLPETATVIQCGGKVVILPLLQGHSTTETLRKLLGE